MDQIITNTEVRGFFFFFGKTVHGTNEPRIVQINIKYINYYVHDKNPVNLATCFGDTSNINFNLYLRSELSQQTTNSSNKNIYCNRM